MTHIKLYEPHETPDVKDNMKLIRCKDEDNRPILLTAARELTHKMYTVTQTLDSAAA